MNTNESSGHSQFSPFFQLGAFSPSFPLASSPKEKNPSHFNMSSTSEFRSVHLTSSAASKDQDAKDNAARTESALQVCKAAQTMKMNPKKRMSMQEKPLGVARDENGQIELALPKKVELNSPLKPSPTIKAQPNHPREAPPARKKPNPFQVYRAERMKLLRSAHPLRPYRELLQEISKEWRSMDDEQKSKYKVDYSVARVSDGTQPAPKSPRQSVLQEPAADDTKKDAGKVEPKSAKLVLTGLPGSLSLRPRPPLKNLPNSTKLDVKTESKDDEPKRTSSINGFSLFETTYRNQKGPAFPETLDLWKKMEPEQRIQWEILTLSRRGWAPERIARMLENSALFAKAMNNPEF